MSASEWEVVGGEETGGILVREGESLSSDKCDARLAHGSKVEGLSLVGERLEYKLQSGDGPETGWVSIKVKGKDLVVRLGGAVEEEPEEALPPREPGTEAQLNLTTTVEGKKQGSWQLKVPADCMTVGDWKAGVKDKQLLNDDTVCKFADRLSVKRIYSSGKMGPRLSDDAQLPVDPAKVFVSAPGAIQTALAVGLKDDFGDPFVPPSRKICVKSTAAAVHGGYEETFGGSQVFLKKNVAETGAMSLFRDQDHGKWFFGESAESFSSYVLRSDDDAGGPQDAHWPSAIQRIALYDEESSEADSALWEDAVFPHTDESVGGQLESQLSFRPRWYPARRLGGEDMKLFDGIAPTDLLQGQIGDCWLIAAMAGLAEFPDEVRSLFKDKGEKVQGRYSIRLFNHHKGEFEELEVDEFVPCLPKEWYDLEGTPLFARPNGSEIWVVLLEKAMAKLFGCYSELVANNCGVAFRAFTGTLDNLMWMKPEAAGGAWLKYKIMKKGFDYDPCMQDPDYRVEPDTFFKKLLENDKESFLMSASLQISHSMEYRRSDGLMEGHAYTLLKVAEVDDQQLVLLRNPWGNEFEWNGAWSDKSDMWDRYPKVKEALRPSFCDDGLFWMNWEDFNRTWDMVNVCCKTMRTGEARAAHMKTESFVSFLGKQERMRKPRRVQTKLKPVVMLKVVSNGDDETEAASLPPAEVSSEKLLAALLRRIFRQLDSTGDGKLQLAEATAGLTKMFGVDSNQVKRGQEVFQALDELDGADTGALTEDEFVKAGLDYQGDSADSSVMAAMKTFNASHSLWAAISSMKMTDEEGNIGKEEIAGLLKEAAVKDSQGQSDEYWQQAAAQLIKEKDKDDDGCLNIQEWLSLMGGMTSLCEAGHGGAVRPSLKSNAGQVMGVSKAIQKLKDERPNRFFRR